MMDYMMADLFGYWTAVVAIIRAFDLRSFVSRSILLVVIGTWYCYHVYYMVRRLSHFSC